MSTKVHAETNQLLNVIEQDTVQSLRKELIEEVGFDLEFPTIKHLNDIMNEGYETIHYNSQKLQVKI